MGSPYTQDSSNEEDIQEPSPSRLIKGKGGKGTTNSGTHSTEETKKDIIANIFKSQIKKPSDVTQPNLRVGKSEPARPNEPTKGNVPRKKIPSPRGHLTNRAMETLHTLYRSKDVNDH